MPDDLKQLEIDRALMRLSGTFPQAMVVKTMQVDPYMNLLDAYAAVHPLFPKTILHRSDLANDPMLEEILAHELHHVGSMSKEPNPFKRFFGTVKANVDKPYEQRDEELAAQATGQEYEQRAAKRRRDIPLKP